MAGKSLTFENRDQLLNEARMHIFDAQARTVRHIKKKNSQTVIMDNSAA